MGVKVALWTVDTEKAVRSLLPLGPDCIVTNRPDRVREWVEESQCHRDRKGFSFGRSLFCCP